MILIAIRIVIIMVLEIEIVIIVIVPDCYYCFRYYCYSTDYSQQASCLLQTGQLSIYLVTATSRLASQASQPVNQEGFGRFLFQTPLHYSRE